MPTPWDAFYKQVLQRFFQEHKVAITTEVEVGRLPKTIDIAVICSQEESQRLALVSPFTSFSVIKLLQ